MGASLSSQLESISDGADWKSKVYFDSNADQDGLLNEISDGQLLHEMKNTIESNERLEKIWMYKHPLSSWQLTQFVFNHQFIVVKTNTWYWSFEKNSEGITVQRAKAIEYVRDCYRQAPRSDRIVEIKSDEARKGMKELIKWLYETNELNKEYHWYNDNSQEFVKRMFNEFSNTGNLERFEDVRQKVAEELKRKLQSPDMSMKFQENQRPDMTQ